MVDIYECIAHVLKLFLFNILYMRKKKKKPNQSFGGNCKYNYIISICRQATWVFSNEDATVIDVCAGNQYSGNYQYSSLTELEPVRGLVTGQWYVKW